MCLVVALGVALCLGLIGVGLAQDPPNPKKLNPYDSKPEAAQEGRALYLKYGCSGCHGVGGGGGMGPPILDDVWKFGSSDEVLFKLIKGEIPQSTMPKVFTASIQRRTPALVSIYSAKSRRGSVAAIPASQRFGVQRWVRARLSE